MSAMSCSTQYRAIPLVNVALSNGLAAFWTETISATSRASMRSSIPTFAQPDVADLALILKALHRADALVERYVRVGRMQLVEIERLDPQRLQACHAGLTDVPRRPVGLPLALRADQPRLGRDDNPAAISRVAIECLADETLVVTRLLLVEAVRVRRVDQRDALIPRGVQDANRVRRVGASLRRQAHRAQTDWSDRQTRCADPSPLTHREILDPLR